MGFKYMEVAPTSPSDMVNKLAFEQEINLAGAGDSDWILIPASVQSTSVTISFAGGGQGKVQTTTDTVAVVKEGTNVVNKDWSVGVVSNITQDWVVPVTAIRLVQTSVGGSSKLTIRAQ